MVRDLFERIAAPVRGFVMRPIRSLHQAAYLLAALTLASQMLALLRDRTFAHLFGAGETLDLYYAAFRVPDLVFALISSLVSAYVLIPRITGMDTAHTKRLLSESATFLVGFGGIICVVLAVYMPEFLALWYPNLTASPEGEAFVLLARLLLVQPILLGLSGVLASVTQVNRRFVLFALSPVLYNVGIILGTVALYPLWGLPGIGMGVVLGAAAYLMVNVPVVLAAGVFPRIVMPTRAIMAGVIRDSVPRSLALGVGSATWLVLTAFAARIETGAVSVLTFAANLEAVPLALIGSSYAVAAFPALSEMARGERKSEFAQILFASARHVILWSLVALGLIAVLRAHIVRAVLGTGAFDWDATRLTAALLAVLAVGLVAQGLALLASRALYAARQSWRPLFYQLGGALVTIALAAAWLGAPSDRFLAPIARALRVSDVAGNAVLIIAIASTAGSLFLAFLSLVALRSVAPGMMRTLLRPVIDGGVAGFAGAVAAYGVLYIEGGIAPLTTLAAVVMQGLVAGLVGLSVAAATLYCIENEEFKIVVGALIRLVRRSETVTPVLMPSADEPKQP